MGPAEPVPYTLHWEAPHWRAGKIAVSAKRVALVTRVAPLPGISQFVSNKTSSERITSSMMPSDFCMAGVQWHNQGSLQPQPSGLKTPALGSCVAGTTEKRFCNVAQAGLEFLGSSDPSTLASRSAGIIGGLTLSPRLACNGAILAHSSLDLPGLRPQEDGSSTTFTPSPAAQRKRQHSLTWTAKGANEA
ncbi:hypothetical protein AAY473_023745 [Plecturocebus cupreus]